MLHGYTLGIAWEVGQQSHRSYVGDDRLHILVGILDTLQPGAGTYRSLYSKGG